MNMNFGSPPAVYHQPYMGQFDFAAIDRDTLVRWTVAGVVTMGALLAARALFVRRRRRRKRR